MRNLIINSPIEIFEINPSIGSCKLFFSSASIEAFTTTAFLLIVVLLITCAVGVSRLFNNLFFDISKKYFCLNYSVYYTFILFFVIKTI